MACELHKRLACVDPAGAILGEGPVWVSDEEALYWVDIEGCRIHRYHPASHRRKSWPTPFRIGSIAPRQAGGFVGAGERGFVLIDLDAAGFTILGDPEPSLPRNRFNDGKLDQQGRYWAGTMDHAEQDVAGALYRLDANLEWSCADRGYAVTNGPAFSPDGRLLYHTDSAARTIYRFELSPGGELTDKRVFARFAQKHGSPDGMTVDAEGYLWVAFWDGWSLRRLSPEGEIVATLELPVQRPTSCAFGGKRYELLFVTSATKGIAATELAQQPLAGGLFVAETGVTGFASPPFPS